MVERIIPAELEHDELFRRNGEYVPAVAYDALMVRADRMAEALEQIRIWSQAYPRDIFVPPNEEQLRDAHASLVKLGMSLDKFSAHAMRHVAEGVGKIADAALTETSVG